MVLESMDFEAPKNEFPNGYPSHLLILDDMVGQKGVFNANCKGYLTEFILQSRHHSCSVIILSQVFKNFLPAQLRQGSFDKWVLFGTKSKHRVSIAEEMSDKIAVDEFLDIWDYATDGGLASQMLVAEQHLAPQRRGEGVRGDVSPQHTPLVVDYTAPKEFMFRKGFDLVIQGD
jgi:hypothetical protein